MPRHARTSIPEVFAPAPLGPLTLRNRIIKAATFEGVMPGGKVSDELVAFHRRVAAGGAAMSTVAYLAVSPEGRTDRHCLLLDHDTVPGLRRVTEAVHVEGAAAAAQIGHAGPVANARSNGAPALSPSGGLTPMGSRLRAVDLAGIERITEDYRHAATLAVEAGFDSLEVHVGHNYLLSAFLSPKLNRRDDQFGGSVANRARFARTVLRTVRDAAGPNVAVTAKLNMADGVDGGLWVDESLEVAALFEEDGTLDALELTGGSSLANPMYLFRGDAPLQEFGATLPPAVRLGFRVLGHRFLRTYPFEEAFFLPYAAPVPACAHHTGHPAGRHHETIDDRGGTDRGLRVRGHGPCPPARARSPQPHAGRDVRRVAVHPLQQVHADDLFGDALRPGGRPPRFRLGTNRRPACCPRRRQLQLAGEGQQGLLVTESSDELLADRQSGLVPVQRERDPGLPRDVERRRERHVRRGSEQPHQGLAGGRVERAEGCRRLAQGGGEQHVELLEGGGDLAGRLLQPLHRRQILCRVEGATEFDQCPAQRLDVLVSDRPPDARLPVRDSPGIAGGPGVDEVRHEGVAVDVERRFLHVVAERLAQAGGGVGAGDAVGVNVAPGR